MKPDLLTRITQLVIINFVLLSGLGIYISQQSPSPLSASPSPTQFSVTSVNEIPQVPTQESSKTVDTPLVPQPTPRLDPLAQVSKHSIVSDCWLIVAGQVYNITTYFGSHPGGDGVLGQYCGQDATSAFASKDQNPPNPHSSAAQQLLSQYLIQ